MKSTQQGKKDMILSMFSLSQSSFTGRGQHLLFLLSYVINYYQNTLEKPECSMTKKKFPGHSPRGFNRAAKVQTLADKK